MEMNKQTLTAFREDFAKAVAFMQLKYGVEVKLGHITYYQDHFVGKLEVQNAGTTERRFEQNAESCGLPQDALGKSFRYKNRTYTITDLKPGNKFCVCAKRDDGKSYSFTKQVFDDIQLF